MRGNMDMWLKSNRQFVVNVSIVVFGYLMGAAQPQNNWQWLQFAAGMGVAVGGMVKAAWNDTPGTVTPLEREPWRQP